MRYSALCERAALVLAAAVLVTGCAGVTPSSRTQPGAGAAAKAASARTAGHPSKASALYQQAASAASTPARQGHWTVRAGLAALDAGQPGKARALVRSVSPDALESNDRGLLELAQQRLAVRNRAPADALDRIAPPSDSTPDSVAEYTWATRARLQFAAKRPVAGVQSLVERGRVLSGDAAKTANNKRILSHARDAVDQGRGAYSPAAQHVDATTRGWLELAAIGQQVFASAEARDSALSHWVARHPDHPANAHILADEFGFGASQQAKARHLKNQAETSLTPPGNQRIALAVPLSGRYKAAGAAIRDGFVFAHNQSQSTTSRPMIWDSAQMSAHDLQARARRSRIGLLVGPLQKNNVTALANQYGGPATIALNHSRQPVQRSNFLQFGLAPEDEARSAARYALDSGQRRALALVPAGDRGSRLLGAFRSALEAGGGTVVDQQRYKPDSHDHSAAIKSLLGRYNSRKHRNPRDIDFIFVAANPTQGRLIHSQLRYYHASRLPMVSTALIYSGHPQPDKDVDLNGVHFVDMPWILGQGATIENRRDAAKARFSNQAQFYQRLFALGLDAWLLARHTLQSGLAPDQTLQGMTGLLQLQPTGVIRRGLAWAQFKHGQPKLLAMPSASQMPAPGPGSKTAMPGSTTRRNSGRLSNSPDGNN